MKLLQRSVSERGTYSSKPQDFGKKGHDSNDHHRWGRNGRESSIRDNSHQQINISLSRSRVSSPTAVQIKPKCTKKKKPVPFRTVLLPHVSPSLTISLSDKTFTTKTNRCNHKFNILIMDLLLYCLLQLTLFLILFLHFCREIKTGVSSVQLTFRLLSN